MASSGNILHVDHASDGIALSTALRQLVRGESWSRIKRLIQSRHVQVNGNLCLDPGRTVKRGDVVKVLDQPSHRPPDARDITIRHVDEHLLVVEKPAGITTTRHAAERDMPAKRKQLQPTLDELLPAVLARKLGWRVQAQGKRKPGPGQKKGGFDGPRLPRVRAVHRLDRDTSGLMIFARTAEAEQLLVSAFSRHRIERIYTAVVLGDCKAQKIDTVLVRDRGDGQRGSADGQRGSADETDDGQRAVTHVTPMYRLGDYTVVECKLETGRTHQIRIHLSEAGHAICGDKIYRSVVDKRVLKDASGAPRQALHAGKLNFVHPVTGERLSFEMPLPDDLARWLSTVR